MHDELETRSPVGYREIRTVFKPTFGTGWFHLLITFPRVECDGIVSDCSWGFDKALVKDGAKVTVGFSYRFGDTKLRCRSDSVEVSASFTELAARNSIINNSPMLVTLR